MEIFDICTYVMRMSSFRYAPHQVHIYRVNITCAYLDKISNTLIRVRTEEHYCSSLPYQKFDSKYYL